MATATTQVELKLASSQYETAMARARGLTTQFHDVLSNAPTNLASAGITELAKKLGPAALGAGAMYAIKSMVDSAAAANDLSEQSGLTATQCEKLKVAFENAGLGGDAFVASVNKITASTDKAVAGNVELTEAFGTLGLSAKNLATMDAGERLKEVMDALDPQSPEQMAAALQIIGKTALSAIPALKSVAEDMDKTNANFDSAAASCDAFGDEMNAMTSEAKVTGITLLQIYGEWMNKLEYISSNGMFGTLDSTQKITEETKKQNKELREIVQNSEWIQKQQREYEAAKTKAANLADREFQLLLSQANIMPELISLASELQKADETYTEGVERRGKLYAEEVDHLIDLQAKIQTMAEEANKLTGDARKDKEKEIQDTLKLRAEGIKRVDALTSESAKAEATQKKYLADLSKEAAKDQADAQKELNALLNTELDTRREIVREATKRVKDYNDSKKDPNETAREAQNAFMQLSHDLYYNPEKAAKNLPGVMDNLDLLKNGKNPLQQSYIDEVLRDAADKLNPINAANDKAIKSEKDRERAALEGRLGGLPGAPEAMKQLKGVVSPEAAVAAATYQSTMLSETIRIRVAVEAGLSNPKTLRF